MPTPAVDCRVKPGNDRCGHPSSLQNAINFGFGTLEGPATAGPSLLPSAVHGEDHVLRGRQRVARRPASGTGPVRREGVRRGHVVELGIYPHPAVLPNRLLSFTMKSTSCSAPGIVVGAGASGLFRADQ